MFKSSFLFVCILFSSSLIVGCDGNSTTSTSNVDTLQGVAAVGLGIDGTVTVIDAVGASATSTTDPSDGSYTVEVPSMTPPFMLRVISRTDGATYYSFAPDSGQTVNITPLTNLAISLVFNNTDLESIFSNWDGSQITTTQLEEAQVIIRENLSNQLSAAELDPDSFDFFNDSFETDGTGIDGILDTLVFSIDESSGTISFIDITDPDFSFDPDIFVISSSGNTDSSEPSGNNSTSGNSSNNSGNTGTSNNDFIIDPNATFTTGQNAALILGEAGFDDAGFLNSNNDGLILNHNKGIASDGTRLLVADGNNNRVLIWSTLPTGNQAPDLVLGQTDFTNNSSGSSLNQMNWPTSVAITDTGKVFVTDAYNNRVLVWNTFPENNGQAADFIISENNGDNLGWPWDVWTDSTKLIVVNTAGSKVLIWNQLPTSDTASDYSITANNLMGTPRSVTTDGSTFLLVSDHNPNIAETDSGDFYWNSFPLADSAATSFIQDFSGDPKYAWLTGDVAKNGNIYLLAKNIYKLLDNNALFNETVDTTISTETSYQNSFGQTITSDKNFFTGGDGSDLVVVDTNNDGTSDRMYVSDYNGNHIIGFNNIDVLLKNTPDFVIGANDLNTSSINEKYHSIGNPIPACNADKLFVISDFDRAFHAYTTRPSTDGQEPDFKISFDRETYQQAGDFDFGAQMNAQPTSVTLHDDKLLVYAGGDKRVYYWNTLPTQASDYPDEFYIANIGDMPLGGDLTFDDTFIYTQKGANQIALFDASNGFIDLSDTSLTPDIILTLNNPSNSLKTDGTYLTITQTFIHTVVIFKISDIIANGNATLPYATISTGNGNGNFNLPSTAITYGSKLFIVDNSNNRVQVWNDITDAKNGLTADTILGQSNSIDVNNKKTRDGLFWPSGICFNGKDLWVGEFKFSGRLVKFEAN